MDKEQLKLAITKALAYTENGGKPKEPKAGKSGEMKSIFQFEPSTWKLYAKQVLGQDAPLTSENEADVVHKKVSDWVDHFEADGVSPEEIPLKIASMWNAGERRPDAYKENVKGTNKYGVEYDTPAYAKKVADYTKEFMSGKSAETETAPTMQSGQKQGGMISRTPVAPTGQMPDSIGGLLKMGGVPQV